MSNREACLALARLAGEILSREALEAVDTSGGEWHLQGRMPSGRALIANPCDLPDGCFAIGSCRDLDGDWQDWHTFHDCADLGEAAAILIDLLS